MAISSFVRADPVNHGTQGDGERIDVEWICRGTNLTPTEVLDRAQLDTDSSVDGKDRKNISFREITQNHYRVTAHYAVGSDPETRVAVPTGEITFAFEDTVVLQNVKTAIETVQFFPDPALGGKEPDLKEAINVQGLGKDTVVEGTDIFVAESAFSYSLTADSPFFTDAYRRRLGVMRTMVNDAQWKGYERGEVLFMGTQGRVDLVSGKSTIALRFAVRPNIVIEDDGTYSIGGISQGTDTFEIGGIPLLAPVGQQEILEGWFYVDVHRVTRYNETTQKMEESVDVIRFLRNYRYADFNLLGLP